VFFEFCFVDLSLVVVYDWRIEVRVQLMCIKGCL